jgi:acid phosphatase family membrane protein YuiD
MPRVASALDNCGLIAAFVAVVAAQALKPLTARVAGGAWRPALALASGGFPSSHSAFVTALAAGVGAQWGYDSGSFACACAVSAVVMYDAMGVRRQAGFHATAINTLVANAYGTRGEGATTTGTTREEMDEGGGMYRGDAESGAPQAGESLTDTLFDEGFDAFVGRLQERPLREHIGHTPVQVVAGAVTGIVIGIAVSFSVVGLE